MRKQGATEYLLSLVEQYRSENMPWPATAQQIAEWAWRRQLYTPQPNAAIRELAGRLSDALREELIVDPQGRSVRAKHVARTEQPDGSQLSMWDDIRTAPHEHMEIAFQQRRNQIVGDCVQLKADVDSYNENRLPPRPIQLVLDFTDDVAEREAMDGLPV
jgi:hypothetical protein